MDDSDPPWIRPDTGTDDPARIVITPSSLIFDVAASDGETRQALTFENEGDADVRIYNTAPELGEVFANADPLARPLLVPAGESAELEIAFTPPHGGRFEDSLMLEAPDAVGVGEVKLIGRVSGPTVVASSENIGATLQWCRREGTVLLRNDGPDEMPVYGVRLEERGEQRGCDSFQLDPEAVASVKDKPVIAGEVRVLPIDFVPQQPGPLSCTLEIDTALAEPVPVTVAGLGETNPRTQETFYTSDGTAAHVLIILDDAAADVNDHHGRLRDGLPELVRSLDIAGVNYRIAAPSTEDGCAVGSPRHGVAGDDVEQVVETLVRNLFTPQSNLASQPLLVMTRALGGGSTCFPGWIKSPDPMHVVIVSARGDTSSRSVTSFVAEARAEIANLRISTVTPRSGCGPSTPRLDKAASDTGGATYDLCASSWDRVWAGIAQDTADMRHETWSTELLADPLPGSVRVAVDSIATDAWTLDGDDGRTLTLEPVFPDNAEVRVGYADSATCR